MKIIDQSVLYFKQGSSDKVYEVDLLELATDSFVVNFRYGRRGAALRSGTKTSLPVDEKKARNIYDALVKSKMDKGYSKNPHAIATTIGSIKENVEEADIELEESTKVNPIHEAVIKRLREGKSSSSTWSLSRAVWRAGELRLQEAESHLLVLANESAMMDYCLAWSLGRLGSDKSISLLNSMAEGNLSYKEDQSMVRRMAVYALLNLVNDAGRDLMIQNLTKELPVTLQNTLNDGPALYEATVEGLPNSVLTLDTLYAINNEACRFTVKNS